MHWLHPLSFVHFPSDTQQKVVPLDETQPFVLCSYALPDVLGQSASHTITICIKARVNILEAATFTYRLR